MTTEEVPFKDIPDSVLEEVRRGLQDYFVPLVVMAPGRETQPADVAGSGTLVEVAGRHYILTADHVWNGTAGWPQVGLVTTLDWAAPLTIPRDGIEARRLGDGRYSEWGPDLALLEIPRPIVATIQARKSFLNLELTRLMLPRHPLRLQRTVWAVVGVVGVASHISRNPETRVAHASIQSKAFFGSDCEIAHRNGFDYLTTLAKTTLPDVPPSFKGVSGGPLWQIGLAMKKATGAISWTGERHLRGVAFWEEPKAPDLIQIRFHGPDSIFTKAWAEWGLPTPDSAEP